MPEPLGGANRDASGVVASVIERIDAALERLSTVPAEKLLAQRYEKYRRIGAWERETAPAGRH